ncbi:MAG: DUF411 domain-containing protein [Gammaproteobacteria bacterium]
MKLLAVLLGAAWSFASAASMAESFWDKPAKAVEKPIDIVVYRSSSCGCCGKWVQHLQHHQFNVQDNVTDEMDAIKTKYGVPQDLASCHTAVVNGYVIEGHVPAGDIKILLKNKPAVAGISVPGMVTGTPGMEMGDRLEAFDVLSFDKNGKTQIFHHYGKP